MSIRTRVAGGLRSLFDAERDLDAELRDRREDGGGHEPRGGDPRRAR